MFIALWEIWLLSCMFWALGDELKGEIQHWKPRNRLSCVQSWESHTDWKTTKLDNRMLIELELNQKSLKNCDWLVLGIHFTLKEHCETSIVGFETSNRWEGASLTNLV